MVLPLRMTPKGTPCVSGWDQKGREKKCRYLTMWAGEQAACPDENILFFKKIQRNQ